MNLYPLPREPGALGVQGGEAPCPSAGSMHAASRDRSERCEILSRIIALPLYVRMTYNAWMRGLDGILRPKNIFALIAVIFGLLMVALMPPFHAPDEWNHFFRAYQVSEGHVFATKGQDGRVGGYMPQGLLVTAASVFFNIPYSPDNMPALDAALKGGGTSESDLNPFGAQKKALRMTLTLSLFDIRLEPQRRVFIAFANTGRFAPVAYLPQAIGIGIGRALGMPPVGLMYMARLFNLALWIALVWFALGLLPSTVLYVLALMPVAIYQAASVSADAVANGAAFVLVAAVLSPRGRLWIIGVMAAVLAVTKFYVFLPAIYGMRAIVEPEHRRRHVITALALVAGALLVAGAWLMLTRDMITPLRAGIDPGGQLKFMLGDIAGFIGIAARTFQAQWGTYATEFVAQMGHVEIPVPGALSVMLWAVALLAAASEGIRINGIGRALAAGVSVASVATFALLSYITWTPVGEAVVQGIQGRYFIPLGPVAALMLAGLCDKFNLRPALMAGSGLGLTASLWLMASAYY